jgi:hypothetical protein
MQKGDLVWLVGRLGYKRSWRYAMGVILETNVWGCMVRVLILKHEGDPAQEGQVSVYNSGSLELVAEDCEPDPCNATQAVV